MSGSKRDPVIHEFVELKQCPKCAAELAKIHDQKYPSDKGVMEFVIYRCANGHETQSRQLVVEQSSLPPKDLWSGWAS